MMKMVDVNSDLNTNSRVFYLFLMKINKLDRHKPNLNGLIYKYILLLRNNIFF